MIIMGFLVSEDFFYYLLENAKCNFLKKGKSATQQNDFLHVHMLNAELGTVLDDLEVATSNKFGNRQFTNRSVETNCSDVRTRRQY